MTSILKNKNKNNAYKHNFLGHKRNFNMKVVH